MNQGNTARYVKKWWTSGSIAATANSGTIVIPNLSMLSIWFDITGSSQGTSPTLDVSLQTSPDLGTTWLNTGIRTAQTTSASTITMNTLCPLGTGNAPLAAITQAVAATGGILTKDTVLSNHVRILATIGGTNPLFVVTVWAIGCIEAGT